MADKRRAQRVAEQIREIVAEQLPRLSDPGISMLSITAVTISSDLRHAKVYWSLVIPTIDDREVEIEKAQAALDRARSEIRREVAQQLSLRAAPVIGFYYDDTYDVQESTERLLASV